MIHSSRLTQIPGTLTADPTQSNVSMEKGVLISLMAFSLGETLEPFSTWVEIGIARSASPADRVALLASGYITVNGGVGWSGRFLLDSDCFLYSRAHGITSDQIQVGWAIEADI